LAYIPFLEDDDVKVITIAGDEEVPRAHGLVIRAEKDETGYRLVEVLERGLPCEEKPDEA